MNKCKSASGRKAAGRGHVRSRRQNGYATAVGSGLSLTQNRRTARDVSTGAASFGLISTQWSSIDLYQTFILAHPQRQEVNRQMKNRPRIKTHGLLPGLVPQVSAGRRNWPPAAACQAPSLCNYAGSRVGPGLGAGYLEE